MTNIFPLEMHSTMDKVIAVPGISLANRKNKQKKQTFRHKLKLDRW